MGEGTELNGSVQVLASLVHWLFGFSFWVSWPVIMVAWIGVGVSTLFDDEKSD